MKADMEMYEGSLPPPTAGGYVFTPCSFFGLMLAVQNKKYWTDFSQTWWNDGEWSKKETSAPCTSSLLEHLMYIGVKLYL